MQMQMSNSFEDVCGMHRPAEGSLHSYRGLSRNTSVGSLSDGLNSIAEDFLYSIKSLKCL